MKTVSNDARDIALAKKHFPELLEPILLKKKKKFIGRPPYGEGHSKWGLIARLEKLFNVKGGELLFLYQWPRMHLEVLVELVEKLKAGKK